MKATIKAISGLVLALPLFAFISGCAGRLTRTENPSGGQPSSAPECRLSQEPLVLLQEGEPNQYGSRLLWVWEVDDAPPFWSDTKPESASYLAFLEEIKQAGVDPAPDRLLARSLEMSEPDDPERFNVELALREAPRRIGPINCMEALLMSYQTERMDMAKEPTEFTALFLRSDDGARLKIYWYTVNQAGIGNLSALMRHVEADLAQGWGLWASLHNHNFFLTRENISGVPAPGLSDVQFFRALRDGSGLREAWVTNGFDTIRIPASDFDLFRAAGEE